MNTDLANKAQMLLMLFATIYLNIVVFHISEVCSKQRVTICISVHLCGVTITRQFMKTFCLVCFANIKDNFRLGFG